MPFYDYTCKNCGRGRTEFFKLSAYQRELPCVCGQKMGRVLSLPMLAPDYAGYESPVTGKWIEGRRAHKEELARTGCRLVEKGETEDFKRKLSKRKEEFNQNVEKVVDLAASDLGLRG